MKEYKFIVSLKQLFWKRETLKANILSIYPCYLFNIPYPSSFQCIFGIPLCNVPFLLSCILGDPMLKCQHIFCHLFLEYKERKKLAKKHFNSVLSKKTCSI